MADIDIQPSALTDFARNSQLEPDVSSIQGLASTASNGKSQLPEGNEFFETQRVSIQQVMAYFAQIQQGVSAYRDGADTLAALYSMTDTNLATNMHAAASGGSSTSTASLPA